jgi:hypothetical protein
LPASYKFVFAFLSSYEMQQKMQDQQDPTAKKSTLGRRTSVVLAGSLFRITTRWWSQLSSRDIDSDIDGFALNPRRLQDERTTKRQPGL